jgi:hypothetical protein
MRFFGEGFTDNVSGKMVSAYIDCYGKKWMANSSSPFVFRVKMENDCGLLSEEEKILREKISKIVMVRGLKPFLTLKEYKSIVDDFVELVNSQK